MTIKSALQDAAGSVITINLEFYADKTWRGTSSYQIMRYELNLFLQCSVPRTLSSPMLSSPYLVSTQPNSKLPACASSSGQIISRPTKGTRLNSSGVSAALRGRKQLPIQPRVKGIFSRLSFPWAKTTLPLDLKHASLVSMS